MDKTYLIHNIKFADSAANGHQTLDIELKNLNKEPTDLTADVTIIHNTAGSAPETMNFEGVSLIGAGGEMSNANITIIPKLNGADIPGTIVSLTLQLLDLQFSDYTLNSGEFAYSDEQVEMPIKVPYINYADIQMIAFSLDGGGVYFWEAAEPINIEGNATYINGLIRITGECTITIPVNED